MTGDSVSRGLDNRSLDACYGTPLAARTLRWIPEARYLWTTPLRYALGATVISTTAYNRLTTTDQRVFDQVSEATGIALRAAVRRDNTIAMKAIVRRGLIAAQMPDEVHAALDKASEMAWSDAADHAYSKAELDMVLKYRDEFRALTPRQ
ncbi:MAG: hypothetical protein K8W52_24360 [Deltaproteobacteria bacterium]|nr:hypothetical protein [Deltaproteobacteria bacterium]